MSDATVEELTEEAKKPGKFSIIAALKDRAYPSDEVSVYLDEDVAYRAANVKENIESLEAEDAKSGYKLSTDKAKELSDAKSNLASMMEKLSESKYIFTITGISEGKRDSLYKDSVEKYAIEYKEDKNPFSGEVVRVEVENTERDRYFTNLIWKEYISKISDPNGNLQENLKLEDVVALRDSLPISAQGKINQAVEKIRNSTALFMYTVDEDFLAKS